MLIRATNLECNGTHASIFKKKYLQLYGISSFCASKVIKIKFPELTSVSQKVETIGNQIRMKGMKWFDMNSVRN